jgi:Family of unknown function (DUF6527)
MSRPSRITHRFVDTIPTDIDEGVLYVSIPYTTAVHRCLCGCGNKVTTPIRPKKWHFGFDGETVSLNPSIGNFSFDCQSHYWIERGEVLWSYDLSKSQIEKLRRRERPTQRQTSTALAETSWSNNRAEPDIKGLLAKLRALRRR